MDFYDYLNDNNLTYLLHVPEYKAPVFVGWSKVVTLLQSLVLENKKVIVYGDHDVDGAMCALVVSETLRLLGVTNVDVYQYVQRTHTLDAFAVQQCIQGKYDYFIVCDTGSSENDLELLKRVIEYGTKVVVLDHHQTALDYSDYPESIGVINSATENRTTGSDYHLSAGALCYTVMRMLAEALGKQLPDTMAVYATVSLYSDCMDMKDDLNRAIYYIARGVERINLPRVVRNFLTQYMDFNARFIGFWFAPRINAAFRTESLGVLNDFLFKQELNAVQLGNCIDRINSIYEESRDLVGRVSDIVEVSELNNFVVANLVSVDPYISVEANKLYNYTGLVANMLGQRYKKAAITLCPKGNSLKGSVRDLYGRDYLALFKKFCRAGGHKPAFGLELSRLDADEFSRRVVMIDEKFAIDEVANEPVILQYNDLYPDLSMLRDIASYNEFANGSLPIVLLKKQFIGDIEEINSNYYYKYKWGTTVIQSDYQPRFGSVIQLKPFWGADLKLQVQ